MDAGADGPLKSLRAPIALQPGPGPDPWRISMNPQEILHELKRRRVFRVAAAYAVVAFVVLQAMDLVLPAISVPAWTYNLFVLLALAGFPVAVALAWAFDMTPEGLKRTGPVVAPGSARRAGAWLAAATLGLTVLAGAWWATSGRPSAGGLGAVAATSGEVRSIAVLPFGNLSGDRDDEYFSDGITEDIMTRLGRIGDLRVISRTSVMGYRGTTRNLREIGEELGVSHLLEGTVRRAGERILLTARLVDARTDHHLWADTYDRELTDIFTVQAEVAARIADALEAKLTPAARRGIAAGASASLPAYDHYLQGMYHLNRPGSLDRGKHDLAIEMFGLALSLDPDFAPAYAGLSRAYRSHPALSRETQRDSSLAHARRAIDLAPELPEAHTALGAALLLAGDQDEAETAFRRALALNPSDADALMGRGMIFRARRQHIEALHWLHRGVEADPAGTRHTILAVAYFQLGDLERAEAGFARQIRVAPDFPHPYEGLARILMLRGETERARELMQRLEVMAPDHTGTPFVIGLHLKRTGQFHEAHAWFRRFRDVLPAEAAPDIVAMAFVAAKVGAPEADSLIGLAEDRHGPGHPAVHMLRGRTDEAIAALQDLRREGWFDYWLESSSIFEALRSDPRFRVLVADMRAEADRLRQVADLGPHPPPGLQP
jgi:adenylate cyclase